MAYTKQNFTEGQVLKAEHLNKMEQGIIDNENALADKQPKGNYATEEYVAQKVGEAQLGGNGQTVDLSAYLTKENAAQTYQPKGNYALQSDVNKLSDDVEALKSNTGGSSVSLTVDTEGNATIQ